MILLRGTHELAVANGLVEVDRSTRTILTFREQFADPRRRPGAGPRRPRRSRAVEVRPTYGFLMVGNAFSCALRTGDWDWASPLLDDWLSNEITGPFYLELFVDRAVLTALRGGDPSADIAEAERLVVDFMGDPQYPSYVSLGPSVGGALGRTARRGAPRSGRGG